MLYMPIGKYADSPYYLEELGVGIYTLEELCYFLRENATTLEESIMKSSLCAFIESQLGLRELAGALLELINAKGSLASFVHLILEECGFVSDEELRRIDQILRKKLSQGVGERRKSHGDYHYFAGRFLLAEREYRHALENIDPDAQRELYARCEHNLGCALAGMFRYVKAAECFSHSYELSRDEKTYEHYLLAMRMGSRRDEYLRVVNENKMDQDQARKLEKKLASLEEKMIGENGFLLELVESLDDDRQDDFDKKCSEYIAELEKEYRFEMMSE